MNLSRLHPWIISHDGVVDKFASLLSSCHSWQYPFDEQFFRVKLASSKSKCGSFAQVSLYSTVIIGGPNKGVNRLEQFQSFAMASYETVAARIPFCCMPQAALAYQDHWLMPTNDVTLQILPLGMSSIL